MVKAKHVSALVALSLLAALIYFSDVRATANVLAAADFRFVAAGLGMWGLAAFLRIRRWRYLLAHVDIRLSTKQVAYAFFPGFYLANVAPGRSGDPIRAVLLRRMYNTSFSQSLPSVVVERLFDVLTMVTLGLIGLYFMPPSEATPYLYATMGFFFVAAVTVAFVMSSKKRTLLVVRVLHRLFSFIPKVKDLEHTLEESSSKISESFVRYKDAKTLTVLAVLTLTVWLIEGWIGKATFLALGIDAPVLLVLSIIVISALVGVVSLLPGGIGASEISSVTLFVALGIATLQQAVAAVILMRLVSYWVYMVVGATVMAVKVK